MTRDRDVLDSPAAGAAAIRGGTLRLGGYLAGTALSVASAAVLFRALGVEDSGRYVLAASIATVTIGLADAGLSAIATRELSVRDRSEREAFLRGLFGLRLLLSGVGVAAAIGYAAAAGFESVLIAGVGLAALAALINSLQVALGAVLSVELRLGAVTAAELSRVVATTAGILLAAAVGAELLGFLANLVVAAVIGLVTALWLAGRSVPWRPAIDPAMWRSLLGIAVPFALAAAVGTLYVRIGVLLVDQLSTPTETGLFGISFRIVEVLFVVPQLMVGATFPILSRAARDDATRLRYGVERQLAASVLAGTLLALTIGIGAPEILRVLAGAQAEPAESVLRWHALVLLGSFVAATASFALLAVGRPRAVLAQTLSALVVSVLVSALLIPAHGADGAAIGAVAAEATLCAVGWGLLATGPRAVRALPPELARLAIAAGLALAPALVLPAAPAAVAAAVVFVSAALALGGVPPELVVEARGLVARLRAQGG